MCVGKALSHNFATVTLPVSEAPNWLGAGTPCLSPWGDSGPSTKGGRDQGVYFLSNILLRQGELRTYSTMARSFCVKQLLGAIPIIGHRGPCPAGAWGMLPRGYWGN